MIAVLNNEVTEGPAWSYIKRKMPGKEIRLYSKS